MMAMLIFNKLQMIMTSKTKTFFKVILNKMVLYNIIIEVLLIIQIWEAPSQWFIWNQYPKNKFKRTINLPIPIKKTMEWI
jgi:hypothetical protein